ncbi:MAG: homoserine dehydrogenase, partial [Actinobacteria bacterium]|nr:homoserine dehydrogenase [Actinomycetota bacterium]
MNGRPVRVGLLGCGNVGGALAELIVAEGAAVAERTGVRLEITRVGVRDLAKARPASLPDGVLTDDAEAVVSAADVDVVVETIGGVEPARTLLLDAL